MADTPARPRFTWQINWRLVVATLIFLPILIFLGSWQLGRAEQKRQLLAKMEQAMAAEPLSSREYGSRDPSQLRFHRIRLTGHFDPARFWLVENKIHRGVPGYSVVAPFTDEAGQHFLVDRGWVTAGASRELLPAIETPEGEQTVEGVLDQVSQHPLLKYTGAGAWPQRVLTLDVGAQGAALGVELQPWIIHLDASSPSSLTPIWAPVVVPVAKHLGYAAQWFTMAAALALLSLFANSNLGRVLFHRSPT